MIGFGSHSFASCVIRAQVIDLLAASPQRAPPEVGDMVSEHVQCTSVCRHRVVVEVAANDKS